MQDSQQVRDEVPWKGECVSHQKLDLVLARVLVRRHAQELLPHDGAARGAQQMRQHWIHPRQPLICAEGHGGTSALPLICTTILFMIVVAEFAVWIKTRSR